MSTTPNLSLSYILAAQSQKHVTHNEALRVLDCLVQLSVLDRDLAAPPGSPADGDGYIVGAGASGTWSGHEGEIAAFQDGAWSFYVPREGWIAWISDENAAFVYDGATWTTLSSGGGGVSLNPATGGLIGVNATADGTNRLAVSSAASLFNHDGAGHQQKINKAAAGDTASQLYQTGFSGRAEIGLTGDDDFHFKVSPDGTAFYEAMIISHTSGAITHRAGARHTFSHDATLPGLRLVPAAGDPSSLLDGDLWYNSTTGKFRKREAGVTSDLGASGGGVSDGDKGDITVASSGATWTIDNDVVTNGKLANVATGTLKGRSAAGTGDPEDLTGTQATALLDTFTSGAKGLAPASGGGTTNFLRADGAWAAPSGGGGGGSAQVQVDVVTASGTWSKPAWAKKVEVFLIGPGGGGGSGRNGASATSRSGGGGGAAGAVVHEIYEAADLPSSLDVDIGAGGTGGASQTTNTSNGNAGTAGGDTILRDGATQYLIANGGGGGAGGLNNAVPAGGVGVDGTFGLSMHGAPATQNGGAGVAATPNGTTRGPGSGGCGGGINSSNVAGDSGPGSAGYRVGGTGRSAAGGAAQTTANTAGAAGTDKTWDLGTGGGGAGGKGANASAPSSSGVGGTGGIPGGGGGGGAAALNGQGGSAVGGDGARGEAWFISIG